MATWIIDGQHNKPSPKGDLTAARASFFLLPSGGSEEREKRETQTNKKNKANTLITHIIQASMAKPWVYLQGF